MPLITQKCHCIFTVRAGYIILQGNVGNGSTLVNIKPFYRIVSDELFHHCCLKLSLR